jgi:hypothetical protein
VAKAKEPRAVTTYCKVACSSGLCSSSWFVVFLKKVLRRRRSRISAQRWSAATTLGTGAHRLDYSEGVGQRLRRNQQRTVGARPQGRNPGLELANTFGVIARPGVATSLWLWPSAARSAKYKAQSTAHTPGFDSLLGGLCVAVLRTSEHAVGNARINTRDYSSQRDDDVSRSVPSEFPNLLDRRISF